MLRYVVPVAVITLAGCVSSNVTPIANNTVVISTSAALVCGSQGAQRVALAEAAAETLRRGYDKFIVVGAESANNVRVIAHTPVTSETEIRGSTFGSTFSATGTTTYSGGLPIIGGTHDQDFAIRMFKLGEPGSDNAIDARATLGPQWQEAMAKSHATCF